MEFRDWIEAFEAGLAAHQKGDILGARRGYEAANKLAPEEAGPWKGLGVLAAQAGDLDEGIEAFRRATRAAPGDVESWGNLCYGLIQLEQYEEAAQAGEKAVALDGGSAFAWNNLALARRMVGDFEGSWAAAKRAVEIQPDFGEAKINAACCLLAVGETDASNALFSEVVAGDPRNLNAWSNWLFGLHYSDRIEAEEIRDAHGLYGGLFSEVKRPAMGEEARTVGFVSGDLVKHPVGLFMEPLFANYDRERWRFVVFHQREAEDAVSEKLRGMVDGWHKISRLGDEAAAQLVKDERVDILIDLSGHTAKNRLPLFAMRPAAVQATFLGYSSTTGLQAVDYLIADEVLVPRGDERKYRERVVRMGRSVYCMEVKPQELEGDKKEGVVFGSFNNPYKISPGCIEAWVEILRRVEGARMVLKYGSFDAPEVREALRDKFLNAGIAGERLEFYGWVPYEEHLSILGRVDLALDSFPYTGATTTVDAMRSGTPLVTLAGDRYSARMSASVLEAFGLGDLVTDSVEGYVARACELALDRERLEETRGRVRTALEQQDFSDGEGYAREFERVLAVMWSEVLATKP